MKAVYINSSIPEKEAKRRFHFPENIMMENAAAALEERVLLKKPESVLILCGTGNNGGDGYALARRIFGGVDKVTVIALGEPKTDEGILQRSMAEAAGVEIQSIQYMNNLTLSESDVIVDCIYGTGFHGFISEEIAKVIDWCNEQKAFRLACDIPSGMYFKADETVTMGALKIQLFSDKAKDFAGEIIRADLGISSTLFNSCAEADAYLIEEKDIKLPLRIKKSVYKGNFGHVTVVSGEKAGAGIIAGTAALSFGAGLVSLLETGLSEQNFLMSPELMLVKNIPEKTNAVLLGSGLGRGDKVQNAVEMALDYVYGVKNCALVLDADFFYYIDIEIVLEKLNTLCVKTILTPHPKEFQEFMIKTGLLEADKDVISERFYYVEKFSKKYPNLTLVSKGANTYIYSEGNIFICDAGTNALAKAGSGDVLAGMCISLLAQNYSAKDAAITAVYSHALAGRKFENNYECTPLNLIEKLKI